MNDPSAPAEVGSDLQPDTLQLYLALRLHRDTWAGTLLLGFGLERTGRALALASLAAGAAALFLEQDSLNLRSAQQDGCCTFTVTTLIEAIRILKNEVRQSRAITVALRGPINDALQEAVQRGLQPAAFAFSRLPTAHEEPLAEVLRSRGADRLGGFGLAGTPQTTDLQVPLKAALGNRWTLDTHHAVTYAERTQHDRALLVEAEEGSGIADPLAGLAAHWLQTAPFLFPRALSRATLRRIQAKP